MSEGAAVSHEGIALPVRRSPRRLAWERFLQHRLAVASAGFLVIVVITAVFAPIVTRYAPDALSDTALLGPSREHLVGTDSLGRDLWSRVVYGARVSLFVGVASQLLAVAIGILVGMAAGFFGSWLDTLLMRMTDVMQALPGILMAMLFVTVLGASTKSLVLAIGFASWPVIARVLRAQVLHTRQLQYVDAAVVIGCSPVRILTVHILRNVLGPIIVLVTFGIPQAMFTEALLSYIGLGPPPPNPSWGRIIAESFSYLQIAPHYIIAPAAALSLTLLAFNFVGDGLRDAFDPQRAN